MRRSTGISLIGGSLLLATALLIPAVAYADVVPLPVPETTDTTTVERDEPVATDTATEAEDVLYELETLAYMMLVPLLLTLAIEAPIVALAGRFAKTAWQVGILVNTLTNPVAVLLTLALAPEAYWVTDWLGIAVLGVIEVVVVIVETRIFMRTLKWTLRYAAAVSVMANAMSFVFGWLAAGY